MNNAPMTAKDAYYYALSIIKGRWRDAEPIIMANPLTAHAYENEILMGTLS
jgi:hypothetical protein